MDILKLNYSDPFEEKKNPSAPTLCQGGETQDKRSVPDWPVMCSGIIRPFHPKRKSNYSKLYDITAVPWDVHTYAMPLTQKL